VARAGQGQCIAIAIRPRCSDDSRMPTRGIRSGPIALLSVCIGAFFTAQIVFQGLASGRPIDVSRDLVEEQLYWLTWAALSPLIVAVVRRWPFDAGPIRRNLLRHLVVAIALVPAQTILAFTLYFGYLHLQHIPPPAPLFQWLWRTRPVLVRGVFMGTFFYSVIVGVYSVLHFRRLYAAEQLGAVELAHRGAALKTELARAQLDTLRGQLRPHFLFNTLNAIAVLTADDSARARQMLLRLGSLLRRSLDEERHEVPLSLELAYLDEYVDIQRTRFGDRLIVTSAIDPEVLAAPVPVFLLQPLVENAIVHGAPERDAVATIAIRAERFNGTLRIVIEDNGPGVGTEPRVSSGIGLRNSRERLAQLYGERALLMLENRGRDGAVTGARVTVVIPAAR
jgi:signal transduction histidine kinase